MKNDISTLLDMKTQMELADTSKAVTQAHISNPAQEVECALTNFVVSRLERLESDALFGDLIKMHIRQRLAEFSIDQLLQLSDMISRNNNRSVEGLMALFQGDTGGRIITDHLKDNSAASAAQTLYNNADRDVLQAVSYLSSVISKLGAPQTEVITQN